MSEIVMNALFDLWSLKSGVLEERTPDISDSYGQGWP